MLFNGTFYHLWYFPALVLGACLVYGLLCILGPRWAWLPALLLYAAGLLGDSYFGLTAALPPLRAGYEALFLLFDYKMCIRDRCRPRRSPPPLRRPGCEAGIPWPAGRAPGGGGGPPWWRRRGR